MAWAFVGAADLGDNGGSTSSLSASYTCGSGSNRMLVVVVAGDNTVDDVTGVTYNGVALTLDKKETTPGANNRVLYLWRLLNPASGSHTLTISAATSHYLLACAADYSGIAQTGQPDSSATNQSPSANTLTTTTTVVAANCLVVLGVNCYAGSTPAAASTNDVRRTYGPAFGLESLFDNDTNVASGSFAMTVGSLNGCTAHTVIVSYAPDTGGGGGATWGPLLGQRNNRLVNA